MWKVHFFRIILIAYCIQYIDTEVIKNLNLAELLTNNKVATNFKNFLESRQSRDGKVIDDGPCAGKPCKNNGKCTVKGKGFECSCIKPFSGETCEKDPCTDNTCNGNGICKLNNRGFECICDEDYSGQFCEKFICTDYCKNNGHCVIYLKNGRKALKCYCKRPFAGERCEIETCTEEDNPCKNEGNCSVVDNDFRCRCPEPYSGNRCEVCCVNGYCYDYPKFEYPKAKCRCREGYGHVSAGVCKECNCGGNTDCTFEPGYDGYQKKCHCSMGYEEVDGVCKDCDCGTPLLNTFGCTFNANGTKKCKCMQNYAEINGKCEKCNCGGYYESSGCTFNAYGVKVCKCHSDYREMNGTCVEIPRIVTTETTTATTRITTTADTTTEEFTETSSSTSETSNEYSSSESDNVCTPGCGYGMCVVEGNQYSCKCDPGYKGLNCKEVKPSGPDGTQVAFIVLPVIMIPLMLFSGFMAYRHRSSHKETYS